MAPAQLRTTGVETSTPTRPVSDHFTARTGRRIELARYRDAEGVKEITLDDCHPADVVELDFGEGAKLFTSAEALPEIVPRRARAAAGDRGLVTVPTHWDVGAERGVGELVLRTLSVFGVEPAKKIADLSVAESIRWIESRLFGGQPGVRRVGGTGHLEPIDRVETSEKRSLILLHGTASHTRGSFEDLLDPACAAWQALRDEYGNRIYAFEHPTLSESPLRNAITLLEALPAGVKVDLLSHSRGGLVGELLCLRRIESRRELEWFDGTDRDDDQNAVRRLATLLEEKDVQVTNFVRVACPARGTLLASGRLDVYLSVAFNVVNEFVGDPLVGAVLKDALLEVVRRRTDATELPGLEAMMPESPFISFLHARDGRGGVPVESNLAVVEGSLGGGGFLSELRRLLALAYFLERNDLVVNTAAMTGGIPRATGRARALTMSGPRLTHFGYYDQAKGREAVATVLTKEQGVKALAGDDVRKLDPRTYERLGERESREVAVDVPQVLLVPDVFATRLLTGDDRELWADVQELSSPGALEALAATRRGGDTDIGEGLSADRLTAAAGEQWKAALAEMPPDIGVRIVNYDWRRGVSAAAEALRRAIDIEREGPTHVVAHGLGGLGFLHLLASDGKTTDWWRAVSAQPKRDGDAARAVLLGVPLDGVEALLELAAGEGPIFRALYFLDRSSDQEHVRSTLIEWEGLVDLLPTEALDPSWWGAEGRPSPPSATALKSARARREGLAALVRDPEVAGSLTWVFGAAAQTPRPQESATFGSLVFRPPASDGDGWFRERTEGVNRSQRWYLPSLHTRLPHDVAPALRRLLPLQDGGLAEEGGHTSPELHRDRPTVLRRYVSVAGVYPSQQDLDWLLSGVGEQAVRVEELKTLEVEVAHGGLEYARYPVAVGHYQGDSVLGAEWVLDQEVGGAITQTLALDLFQARAGEGIHIGPPASVTERDDEEAHKGALLIGLGGMGDLKAPQITSGIVSAALAWALRVLQETPGEKRPKSKDADGTPEGKTEPADASIASLLIGTRGGAALSTAQSIESIVLGALLANRELEEHGLGDRVRIKKVQFVELWEDLAHRAAHEARSLKKKNHLFDLREDEEVIVNPHLQSIEGGRKNLRAMESEWSWWSRLTIEEELCRPTLEEKVSQTDEQRRLRFTSTGRRARSEVRSVLQNPRLVDDMIRRSSRSIDGTEQASRATTLFHQLLPNAIKDSIIEDPELVLVVDENTARYPWELLATRRDERIEPLTRRMGFIRQFKTSRFREIVRASFTRRVLVIGDPADTGEPPLDGAREEARDVADLLAKNGWDVNRSIRERHADIVDRLYQHPYRIMHIAAHGRYDPKDALQSGILVGRTQAAGGEWHPLFLSTEVFEQLPGVPDLVFLNCCHLARTDDGGALTQHEGDPRWPELASSVARKLIDIGVRCVVAAGWAVNDHLAREFATTLYKAMIVDHAGFGDAVREARDKTMGSGATPRGTTWGAFQCYGNPTFQLQRYRSGSTPVRPVSETEVMNEIENIALRSPGLKAAEDAEALVDRLEGIIAGVPESWQGDLDWYLASLTTAWTMSGTPHAAHALAAWHAGRVDREALTRHLDSCARRRPRSGDEAVLLREELRVASALLREPKSWKSVSERYARAHKRVKSRAKREAAGRLRFIRAILERQVPKGESFPSFPERLTDLQRTIEEQERAD